MEEEFTTGDKVSLQDTPIHIDIELITSVPITFQSLLNESLNNSEVFAQITCTKNLKWLKADV